MKLLGRLFFVLVLGVTAGLVDAPAVHANAEGCGESLLSQRGMIQPVATPLNGSLSVQDDGLIGKWFASQNPSNHSGLHCHILTIHFESGPGEFAATVDTSTPNGWSMQFCRGRQEGQQLSFDCEVVAQDMPYNADNFHLVVDGPFLIGRNVDDAGVFGSVRFCRN